MSYSSGKTVRQTAEDLGISKNMLARRCAEYAQSKELAFPGHGKQKLSPLEEENRRLRKELAELKEERDILKKAKAIFSRKPKLNKGLSGSTRVSSVWEDVPGIHRFPVWL